MSQVQSYFEDISVVIGESIARATTSIKVALAYFTDKQLLELLCVMAKRGVDVQLVVSDEESNFLSAIDYNRLTEARGEVYFHIGSKDGVLHHKFCVIDGVRVITGSYNWSQKAKNNFENVVVIDDDATALKFTEQFEIVRGDSTQRAYCRESYVLPSGISGFDKTFNGFHAGNTIIFCGQSNAELSGFALSVVNNILHNQGEGVVYLSLRENEHDVVKRLLAIQDGLDYDAISKRQGHLSDYDVMRTGQAATRLAQHDKRLQLLSMSYPDLDEFNRVISRRVMASNAKLVVIDGMETMNNQADFPLRNRFDGLEPFCREIRRIARSKNIPILCLLHTPALEKKRGVSLEFRGDDLGLLTGAAGTIFSIEQPYNYYGITALGDETEIGARHIVALRNSYGVEDRIVVFRDLVSGAFSDVGGTGQEQPIYPQTFA